MDLHYGYRNEKWGKVIGDKIGSFVRFDKDEQGKGSGKYV
jgi:hypothetical protein